MLVSEAEKDAWRGATIADRFGKLLDALIRKLDTNYQAAAISPEKKARAADLRSQLAATRAEADSLRGSILEFDKNYRKRAASSDFFAYFSHNILGGTAVKLAEVLIKRKSLRGYELQVAIAYVWSPKLEQATRAIIQGATAGGRPGFKGQTDLETYLESQDKLTFPPMFTFTDDSGSRWFLGSGYAETDKDGEAGDDVARLSVYMNCYASLFLNTTGKEQLRQHATGGELGVVIDDPTIAKLILSGFKSKQFVGASPKLKTDLEWPLQAGNAAGVRLYIVGVDGPSVSDMLANEIALTTAACNSYLNDQFLRGRDAALRAQVERAKQDPGAFQQGVKSVGQDGTAQAQPTAQNASSPPPPATTQPLPKIEKGKIAPGQRVTPGKPIDDF